MSNRVTIQPTEFKNIGGNESTFGVRVYDDYGQSYDNTWGLLILKDMPKNDMEILKRVLDSDDEVVKAMMDFVEENKNGIYIGDMWYDWDEIKDCFSA